MDAYLLPDAKGYTSMLRHLIGYTDEARQQIRDEVLGADLNDFHRLAEVLAAVAEKGEVVVLGSAEAIEQVQPGKRPFPGCEEGVIGSMNMWVSCKPQQNIHRCPQRSLPHAKRQTKPD